MRHAHHAVSLNQRVIAQDIYTVADHLCGAIRLLNARGGFVARIDKNKIVIGCELNLWAVDGLIHLVSHRKDMDRFSDLYSSFQSSSIVSARTDQVCLLHRKQIFPVALEEHVKACNDRFIILHSQPHLRLLLLRAGLIQAPQAHSGMQGKEHQEGTERHNALGHKVQFFAPKAKADDLIRLFFKIAVNISG